MAAQVAASVQGTRRDLKRGGGGVKDRGWVRHTLNPALPRPSPSSPRVMYGRGL